MRARAAVVVIAVIAFVSGCGDVNAQLEQQSRARSLSADLLVQFTKAADAANRAVMADTDEISVNFAREADQAKQAVQTDVDALGPLLEGLRYADEIRLLQEFSTRFSDYNTLDRRILELAVENTNLKAQRLSFDPGQKAADEFRSAVDNVVAGGADKDSWRIKALGAEAVSAVREVQVLQAVHIADPDDSAMTQLESQMTASLSVARNNLATLSTLTGAAARARIAAATAALDTFTSVNTEIVSLSRRNTNVRSLALSLHQKLKLTVPCEQSARALHDALTKRGYPAGR